MGTGTGSLALVVYHCGRTVRVDADSGESDAPIRVKATAIAEGNILIVTIESADAGAKMSQIIAVEGSSGRTVAVGTLESRRRR